MYIFLAIKQTLHCCMLAALEKSRLIQGKGRTKERNSSIQKSLKAVTYSARTEKRVGLLEEDISNLNSSTRPICLSSYAPLHHRSGQLDGTGGVSPPAAQPPGMKPNATS